MNGHVESDLLDANIIAKYSSIDEKVFMTLEESIVLSAEIAKRLASWGPQPEAVAGIANGALLVAKIIADRLELPIFTIDIRRRGSGIKQTLFRAPGLRTIFSLLYRVPVINLPLRYAMRQFEGL